MTPTELFEFPTCDVCGEPATRAVRDVQMVPSDLPWAEFKPLNERYGCALHDPGESRILDPNGNYATKLEHTARVNEARCKALMAAMSAIER